MKKDTKTIKCTNCKQDRQPTQFGSSSDKVCIECKRKAKKKPN